MFTLFGVWMVVIHRGVGGIDDWIGDDVTLTVAAVAAVAAAHDY